MYTGTHNIEKVELLNKHTAVGTIPNQLKFVGHKICCAYKPTLNHLLTSGKYQVYYGVASYVVKLSRFFFMGKEERGGWLTWSQRLMKVGKVINHEKNKGQWSVGPVREFPMNKP